MALEKLRRVVRADHLDAAARAVETVDLFLAGPYIDVDKEPDHEHNAATDAKKLRYSLYKHLSQLGASVYLGEDVELRKIGKKNFGTHNNAVAYERHYIKKYIDGTIIIPASPGSYCEMGDWSSDEHICRRMLVIIDKQYEGVTNYINDGIVKLARFFGATIQYITYTDHLSVQTACDEFIEAIRVRNRLDGIYDRAR